MGPGVEQEWIKQAMTHTHTWFMQVRPQPMLASLSAKSLAVPWRILGSYERMEEWVVFPGSLPKGFLSLVESGYCYSTLRNLLGHRVDLKTLRVAGLESLVQMKGQCCFLGG